MISSLYIFSFFFFNDTATTEIYTLSLHDALPISDHKNDSVPVRVRVIGKRACHQEKPVSIVAPVADVEISVDRSEEHTSELQSHLNLVCRLLLEKKKKNKIQHK